MKKRTINLSNQLVTITTLSLIIMIVTISKIIPKSLEPFFEQITYSYLEQPIGMIEKENTPNKNDSVAYIIETENNSYITTNYKEILKIDDYKNILEYINDSRGKFTYKNNEYYYIRKIDNSNKIIAVTTDKYIRMLRKELLKIIIPIIILIYTIILILLLLWSNFIVSRLKKLKTKIDNMNNENFKSSKSIYELNDEIKILDETIDEMKQIILKQDKYKSEMYQNISHDFKTPIAVIKSYIEAYYDEISPSDEVIKVSNEQIIKLENKVKTLMQLNKMTYLQNSYKEHTKIKIYPLIQSIIDKYKMINNKIEYKIKCDKKEIQYDGNEDIWESIITNILSNAIRYANKEIIITIKEDKIIFYNDGEQIDKQIIDKLFEPFKKGKKGENGIGLSIVKRNCDLLKYIVSVKNKKQGVEFIISK